MIGSQSEANPRCLALRSSAPPRSVGDRPGAQQRHPPDLSIRLHAPQLGRSGAGGLQQVDPDDRHYQRQHQDRDVLTGVDPERHQDQRRRHTPDDRLQHDGAWSGTSSSRFIRPILSRS
jgi:hypothetical protein